MDDARDLYHEIMTSIQQNDFKRATKLLQKYEKNQYPPLYAHCAKALIESAKGNEEEAITLSRGIIKEKGFDSNSLTTVVDIFRTWGYKQEALNTLWDYILLFPNLFDLIAFTMFNEIIFGQFEFAQKRALKMLQHQSCSMHYLFVAATSYFAGIHTNNLTFFKFTIGMIDKTDMRLDYTVNMLVDSYNRLGQYKNALEALDDSKNGIIKTSAPDIEHTLRRDTLMKLGKKEEVLQLIQSYLSTKPDFINDYHFLIDNFEEPEIQTILLNKTGPGPDTARLLLAKKMNQNEEQIISLLLTSKAPFSEIKDFLKPEIYDKLSTIENLQARAYIGLPIPDETEINSEESALLFVDSFLNSSSQEKYNELYEKIHSCEKASFSLFKLQIESHLTADAVKTWNERKVPPRLFVEYGEKCYYESISQYDLDSLEFFVQVGNNFFSTAMLKTFDLISNSMNGLIFRQVLHSSEQYLSYLNSPLRHFGAVIHYWREFLNSLVNISQFSISRITNAINTVESLAVDSITENIKNIGAALEIICGLKLKNNEAIEKYSKILKEGNNSQWKLFSEFAVDQKDVNFEKYDMILIGCIIMLYKINNDPKIKGKALELINKAQENLQSANESQAESQRKTFITLSNLLK